MFKKKKCEKCGKKIEEKYSFCPYCGNNIESEDNEDFGMLGKNDFMKIENEMKIPIGLNTLFNSVIKNLSKELDEQLRGNFIEDKPKKIKKDGISISISTFGNRAPKIKINQMGNQRIEPEKINEKLKKNNFTKERIKKFSELKREEPKTNLRRLSNKIIYEIELPGVKSIEDVSIVNLENSIEIKAIGEKKAYAKVIPISLPIKSYDLSEGKLTLELGIKN
jgi:RNA polymerase subunit RPABC4/transcription elongation factor Spt4